MVVFFLWIKDNLVNIDNGGRGRGSKFVRMFWILKELVVYYIEVKVKDIV